MNRKDMGTSKIAIVVGLMLFCNALFGQGIIKGSLVSDRDGNEIWNAYIILDNGKGVLSDYEGNFELSELVWGEYTVVVSYLGYRTMEKVVSLNEEKPVADLGVLVLEEKSSNLREVLVSSTRQPFKRNFEGSNYLINPRALQEIQPLGTEDILRNVPGLNVIGDMGMSNRPNISIRGAWGRRSSKVLMLEDGSPVAPAPYLAPGIYYNPVVDRVESIEVYKGADILRFGPNNMFGAVNYITPRPPQKPRFRAKVAGGQRGFLSGLLSYGGTWNNLGVQLESVYQRFDGFQDNSSVEMINLNAKVYAALSDEQSLYFKVSAQGESNYASLSSITPFTFETDPTQNPFDADRFTMRRYGMDLVHRYSPSDRFELTSKIYATDFSRDWWRQNQTVIRASEARSYLGDEIFFDRYGYLSEMDFQPDQYVRVGTVNNGNESTTNSRWQFSVVGLEETAKFNWLDEEGYGSALELNLKIHNEVYHNRFQRADSSRFARTGYFSTDIRHRLWSYSGYLRYSLNTEKWRFTPIVRMEHVNMFRQDLLALADNPDLSGEDEGRVYNNYSVVLPGLSVAKKMNGGEWSASIYRGFIAPSNLFGFLLEVDGIITSPDLAGDVNIKPEVSWNKEVGWRGSVWNETADIQATFFHNQVDNLYLAGRREVFEKPGTMEVYGLELGSNFNFRNLLKTGDQLQAVFNFTWMNSKVTGGQLRDTDFFQNVVHNAATRSEFISMYNRDPNAFELTVRDDLGEASIYEGTSMDEEVFERLVDGLILIEDADHLTFEAPYTPDFTANAGLFYRLQGWSLGLQFNYVSSQFTEFINLRAESGEGAIGQLDAYHWFDLNINKELLVFDSKKLSVFLIGKNLANDIYRASRLNRATSGIFPGGFRQINMGFNLEL